MYQKGSNRLSTHDAFKGLFVINYQEITCELEKITNSISLVFKLCKLS